MKLSIIIPAFNEKATIEQVLAKVENTDLGVVKEIIIVDDYSSDGTREVLKKYENKFIVLYHKKNHGKGRAIRTGLERASGDWVVIQDADLEYDPADLKILLNKIQEPEVLVVYGSRRLNKDYFKEPHSSHLYSLGGIFLSWLANFLYGTDLTDEPTCYKMFRRDLLSSLNLQCERFEFCPEFTAKVAKRKIKIYEVPISYNPRKKKDGKKINWKDGIEAILTLLKYRFKK